MKHPVRCLVIIIFAALLIRLGNSCAFESDEDVFVHHTDPDAPYASFAAGRLGIVQPEYRIRHLVVAYNVLSGRGLAAAEQKAAVDVDRYYNTYAAETPDESQPVQSAPGVHWELGPQGANHKVPGNEWDTFTNCLSDAFASANNTLAEIRARYGKPGAPDTPDITNWIAGQEAVFSNCSDVGQMPQPAPANAPLWLRQDRAYQMAAAQFYALDYDAALASFRAIGADHASLWSPLARYLVARVLIRKAVVPYAFPMQSATREQIETAGANVINGLAAARDQLESILRDPAMKPLHGQTQRLLDYVMLRLDPAAQAEVLARRITRPGGDPDYLQNVIDLTYAYNTQPLYAMNAPKGKTSPNEPSAQQPLIRWIADLAGRAAISGTGIESSRPGERHPDSGSDDALAMWHATHEPQWLVAALTTTAPGASDSAEMLEAAKTISPTSPAWASATYQRFRLASTPTAHVEQIPSTTRPVYDELSAVMPQIAKSQPSSTINLFADLQSRLAPSFSDFLASATRRPLELISPMDNEPAAPPITPVTLCGVSIYDAATRHLDDATALIFNQRLPLRMLKEAALSPELPPNVRFEVAHMAWTRALLLDDPETARALSPYLAGCQPAFAQWLNQYNAARTADERHVLGLLALMRFTSTTPVVRSGLERDFATYDIMRDNWWCSVTPSSQPTGNPQDNGPHLFTEALVPRAAAPDPPFLTAADRTQADEEIARLQKIPCASDYFAREALAWIKAHPADPRNADLIGFAMRVVRNACRSQNTAELNHQLFDVLHRQFQNSEWAAKYKTWE